MYLSVILTKTFLPLQRFPTTDGTYQRKVEVFHESSKTESKKAAPPIGNSKNVAGPAVYYPPNHTPFQPKEESKSMVRDYKNNLSNILAPRGVACVRI